MDKSKKALLGTSVAIASVLGSAGVAGASATTPTEMATDAAGELTPIYLGVGGALVAVAVVKFGVRWVLSAIGRGGR